MNSDFTEAVVETVELDEQEERLQQHEAKKAEEKKEHTVPVATEGAAPEPGQKIFGLDS